MTQFAQARTLRDAGRFDIWQEEMLSATGDPDDVWQYLATGMPANYCKYSNTTVDDLFTKQTSALTLADRKRLTQQIERQILTDMPIIPSKGSTSGAAWQSYVKGYVALNAGYGPHMALEQVWLNK